MTHSPFTSPLGNPATTNSPTPPSTAETLAQALPRILAVVRPYAIMVFGSRARGDNAPDADLDLLIVLEEPAADPWRMAADIRRATGAIGIGVDILVTDRQRWEDHRRLAGSIEGMAARDGRMVNLDAA